jgi:hypothetical protein
VSERGKALADDVLRLIDRSGHVGKAAGQSAVVERAVAEAAIRALCDSIGRFEEHSEYVTKMLTAMSQPAGPIMPGPFRSQEDFRPQEWEYVRTRRGEQP